MYYKRKIDDYLIKWKADPVHKPLIVKGARQIGKTESILHFARNNYENVVYINFALEKKYKQILADGYDVESLIRNISLVAPTLNFVPGKTVILFDEIQEYPDIATSLKSFRLDGRYDVICSGSMLGINYRKIHSNSVGSKTDYDMYSMDFEEFLWAKGYRQEQIDSILEHMLAGKPFNDNELSVFKRLFLDYCVLGGMPDVVKLYIESETFSGTLDVQRQIMLDYEEDVRKYAEGLDQAKIISVYRSIPAQLAKENKKFQFNKIEKNARARAYTGCIEWLIDAGVISECNCLQFPELPLKGNIDESKYKLYYPDTGLLVSSLDDEAQEDLRVNRNLGVYKGALYENFVAEAFVKQGLGLFYYKKENSTLEEDFFVRTQNNLIPVEVKSNRDQSRSLSSLIKNENYREISYGIKFGDFNIGYANNIYTFPYFCVFKLKDYLKKKETTTDK
ncbi:ATP-binding protein [Succinivibrio dextrinosolvens]|uniref:ATP-binding protein n=1 Tax=Succinivibrio dextrinosolvens TaxID=83771 RepID=UPI00241C51F1|nr:ATP-binding protein [Succinivibrio dextrinosolvens]MBE6423214.1 ATP-binding protein [Succinivibrio dextrinosolvens]